MLMLQDQWCRLQCESDCWMLLQDLLTSLFVLMLWQGQGVSHSVNQTVLMLLQDLFHKTVCVDIVAGSGMAGV